MTDKELLELAAKAVGMKWGGDEFYDEHGPLLGWNPLHDDGDAMRLAVRLKIDIDNMTDACYCEGQFGHDAFVEDGNADPYATARRAIVLVAAKIGRGALE